jgi:chromosomal replication initiation ATPase DnaA
MNDNDVETIVRDLEERNLLSLVLDVCKRRGVLLRELCGRSHRRSASWARQEVWARLRTDPERFYSFPDIARLFRRDHSTVLAGVRAHTRR